ncbi:hypothetical protein ACSSS7_006347 [Eimeria intestinalis]
MEGLLHLWGHAKAAAAAAATAAAATAAAATAAAALDSIRTQTLFKAPVKHATTWFHCLCCLPTVLVVVLLLLVHGQRSDLTGVECCNRSQQPQQQQQQQQQQQDVLSSKFSQLRDKTSVSPARVVAFVNPPVLLRRQQSQDTRLPAAAAATTAAAAAAAFASKAAAAAADALPTTGRPHYLSELSLESLKGKRIIAGLQPSGVLHLGTLLSTLLPLQQLQQQGVETRLLLCDTHALFTQHGLPRSSSSSSSSSSTRISSNSIEALALAMACGLRPCSLQDTPSPTKQQQQQQQQQQRQQQQQQQGRTMIVLQSLAPAHAQLAAWLQSLIPLNWVFRCSPARAAVESSGSVPAGSALYPVHMAADILLHAADIVLVGEDQQQHLEFCRCVARRVNAVAAAAAAADDDDDDDTPAAAAAAAAGGGGPPPCLAKGPLTLLASPFAARVCSLRSPPQKMSKSEASSSGRIELTDEPRVVAEKINKAVTDSFDGKETARGRRRHLAAQSRRATAAAAAATAAAAALASAEGR